MRLNKVTAGLEATILLKGELFNSLGSVKVRSGRATIEVEKRVENTGKLIVAVACDTGERYLSTRLAAEARIQAFKQRRR